MRFSSSFWRRVIDSINLIVVQPIHPRGSERSFSAISYHRRHCVFMSLPVLMPSWSCCHCCLIACCYCSLLSASSAAEMESSHNISRQLCHVEDWSRVRASSIRIWNLLVWRLFALVVNHYISQLAHQHQVNTSPCSMLGRRQEDYGIWGWWSHDKSHSCDMWPWSWWPVIQRGP